MDSFVVFFSAAVVAWFFLIFIRRRSDKKKDADISSRVPPVLTPSTQDARYFDNARIVALKRGSQLTLGVNTQHCSPEAAAELLGQSEQQQFINRSVRLLISRDAQSPHTNTVKVLTTKGHHVGWILDSDSTLACTLIDKLSTEIPRLDISMTEEQFVFEVVAHLEGEWSQNNDQLTALFHVLEIGVKDPAQADY